MISRKSLLPLLLLVLACSDHNDQTGPRIPVTAQVIGSDPTCQPPSSRTIPSILYVGRECKTVLVLNFVSGTAGPTPTERQAVLDAATQWNTALFGNYELPHFQGPVPSGWTTVGISVSFPGYQGATQWCGHQVGENALEFERVAPGGTCSTDAGGEVRVVTTLQALALHELGHILKFNHFRFRWPASPEPASVKTCAMWVTSSPQALNSQVCEDEKQLVYYKHSLRNSEPAYDVDLSSSSVSISPTTTSLQQGATGQFTATTGNAPSGVNWTIADAGIATLTSGSSTNPATVRACTQCVGTTQLTATVVDARPIIWPTATASANVTVVPPVPPITAHASFEGLTTWRMTDQVFSASGSSAGPNIRYRWRTDSGGAWTPYSASPTYEFAGHANAGAHQITLEVKDMSSGISATAVNTITVQNSIITMTGPTFITVKANYTYTASVSSVWYERYPPSTTWGSGIGPTTTKTRTWPGGCYDVDLRADASGGGVLKRGRLEITVAIGTGCVPRL